MNTKPFFVDFQYTKSLLISFLCKRMNTKDIYIMEMVIDRAKKALSLETDKEFAQILGVSTSSVNGYRTRGGDLPLDQCKKVAQLSGVSLDWLVFGDGDPIPSGLSMYGSTQSPNLKAVPLYDVTASAGNGCFFENENILQYMYFNSDWMAQEGLYTQDLACLSVKGDSMSPALQDTDIILLNRAKTRGDGIFVIRIGDALRIKRLQWLTTGELKIMSDNPVYDTEIVNPKNMGEDFEIIGACHTKIGRVL